MKRAAFYVLLALWIVGAAFAVSHLWLTAQSSIPHIPDSFWTWLFRSIQCDGERCDDAVAIVALAVSFVAVLSVTLLCIAAWRRLSRR